MEVTSPIGRITPGTKVLPKVDATDSINAPTNAEIDNKNL